MKRYAAWALILVMLLSITGCKKAIGENGATAGEYIEGEEQQTSGDGPVTVTDWEIVEPSDQNDTPTTSTSSEQEKPAGQPDDKEESPALQQPQEEPEEEVKDEEPTNDGNLDENKLKIVSYNVRCKNGGNGKKILDRSVRFKKVMDQYDPDIMGLQEVVPEWLEYLERDFSGEYAYINQWRAKSNEESTPIFWKKDKFMLVESGHFWLSDTPEQESKAESWGAEYYRICMWAKLKIKATGKTFLFYNTHFDTADSTLNPSARLIIEKAEGMGAFTQFPIFCTGDYNMRDTAEAYSIMYTRFKDVNKELEDLQTPTSNGYHLEDKKGSVIDFCFYSPEKIEPLKYQVIDEYVDGGYVSDHCGIYIEAKLL